MYKSMISPESELLIEWAFKKLEDEEYFESLINRTKKILSEYLSTDKQEIRDQLRQKMTRGAIEHGDPISDFKRIQHELNDEMLDLLGWSMVYAWALHNYTLKFKSKKEI